VFFLFVLFLFFTAGNFIRYELKSQHETKTDRNYVMCISGLTFVRKRSKKVFHQTIVIFSASEMAFQSMSPTVGCEGYWLTFQLQTHRLLSLQFYCHKHVPKQNQCRVRFWMCGFTVFYGISAAHNRPTASAVFVISNYARINAVLH